MLDAPPSREIDLKEVETRARRLAWSFRLRKEDRLDIQQELATEVWGAMQRYNGSQSQHSTFASRILDRHCRHLYRQLHTQRRHKAMCPLPLRTEYAAQLTVNDPGKGEPNECDLVDLRLDLAQVLSSMPDALRQLGESLMTDEPTEVAEQLGRHRGSVYRAVRQLRKRLRQAGITSVA